MTDKLDLAALLRLLAVVEAGSFAEAARRAGVSRQAVHRSVDALEVAAGGPLLDRGAGQLRPTSLGQQLLVHARGLRRIERSVHAEIDHGRDTPSGSLRITAPPLFADVVLAEVLPRFGAKWPAVKMTVRVDSGRTDLVRDDYDLMIRVRASPPEAHYAVELSRAPTCLCASTRYLERHGTPTTPDDLDGHTLLQFGPRAMSSLLLSNDTEEREVPLRPHLISDARAVAVEACLAGQGILYAPEMAIHEPMQTGQLVRLLPDWTLPSPKVWAIHGHRTADDATLREFIAELRAATHLAR